MGTLCGEITGNITKGLPPAKVVSPSRVSQCIFAATSFRVSFEENMVCPVSVFFLSFVVVVVVVHALIKRET